MVQISNRIWCDESIIAMDLEQRILPNPYKEYPYLIIKNFLSRKTLDEIAAFVKHSDDVKKAEVKAEVVEGVVLSEVDRKIRKTDNYRLPELLETLYMELFIKHQKEIEAYFSLALTTSTRVQLLQYKKGYFYIKHSDDSSEIINEAHETIGFKLVAPQRKLTTVLFATTYSELCEDDLHFSGGGLKFNYLFDAKGKSITFHPQAGDMIVFPSNPIFSHEVLPVSRGNRITMVQWHDAIIT